MTLYFISGNKGKVEEVKSILDNVKQLDIDLDEIQSINAKEIIEAKLKEATKRESGEFFVEDTSLYLDCMNGLPGPLIKWFLKTIGVEGLHKIAQAYDNYKAQAKCIIGYINGDNVKYFEGVIEGQITQPKGDRGFGWDFIFQPIGYDKTFAQMSLEEKNKISMRKKALIKLKEYLKQ